MKTYTVTFVDHRILLVVAESAEESQERAIEALEERNEVVVEIRSIERSYIGVNDFKYFMGILLPKTENQE